MELSAVRQVLLQYSSLFLRAYIYGSVALGRGDENSDVDLVLIRETELPFFERVREVFDIILALAPVDIMIYSEQEFRDLLLEPGRYFLKDVAATGVMIEGTQGRGSPVAAASGK